MSSEDYKKLGLNVGASEEEVKKAFKNLAKKCHPDKGGNEEKFKEINEAYSNITKRDPSIDFDLGSIFSSFMNGGIESFLFPKGPTIYTNLKITLQQLETGGEFDIEYTIKKVVGMKQTVHMSPFGQIINQEPQTVDEIVKDKITLPACYDINEYFALKVKTNSRIQGDLLVRVVLEKHETYELVPDTFDLKTSFDITLKEALTGFKRKIKLLNSDTNTTIECENIVSPYDVKRVSGLGLGGKGDLVITFVIQFPVLLDESVKKTLSEILD
jgi:DnaJ-class molecular chaperone